MTRSEATARSSPDVAHRRRVGRLMGVAAVGAGVALVALPDDDDRVFSLSGAHGPAAVDLLGIVLLCAGWVLLLVCTAGPMHRVRAALASGTGAVACGVLGLGVGLVLASVFDGFGSWWLLGAVAAAAGQVVLAVTSRRERQARPSVPTMARSRRSV